ncbi:hypothetical protein CDCA_CDCA12G3355 [Cyanidium caldarium]|uniref:GATA-type domain-containing protein n=1 Tax=Cyanidium caldarium TaxID=2771 RepID=A0AAV9IZ40_CYACA|nr:hypothetical protein CDCA_CDCA12G3355 [Cyanidium caldarium]
MSRVDSTMWAGELPVAAWPADGAAEWPVEGGDLDAKAGVVTVSESSASQSLSPGAPTAAPAAAQGGVRCPGAATAAPPTPRAPMLEPAVVTSAKEHDAAAMSTGPQCLQCGATETPLWRSGPLGPKTLCNACGVRYKKRLHGVGAGLAGGRRHSESGQRSRPIKVQGGPATTTHARKPRWDEAARKPGAHWSTAETLRHRGGASGAARAERRPERHATAAAVPGWIEDMTPPPSSSAPYWAMVAGASVTSPRLAGVHAPGTHAPTRHSPREPPHRPDDDYYPYTLFDADAHHSFGFYCLHEAELPKRLSAPVNDTDWARKHYFIERPTY